MRQNTHNASLKGRFVDDHRLGNIVPVAKAHDIDVASGGVYSSHHTLIIAKEENRESSNAVDGDQKCSLLKAMDQVELWDTLHDISDE